MLGFYYIPLIWGLQVITTLMHPVTLEGADTCTLPLNYFLLLVAYLVLFLRSMFQGVQFRENLEGM